MSSKKILVVDDEPMVAALLKVRVTSRGFVVEVVNDGTSAIEKARTWLPDLILLDIAMPGIDGFETCRRLKGMPETGHIPVVFFSAVQDPELEAKARKAGAVRVVQKPFVDQVFHALSEILTPEA